MATYKYHQDTRDGKAYKCVLMPDGKWWSAENLNWDGAGVYYNNDPANGPIYGRLYTWTEAGTSVPPGTHLPTDAEWTVLENSIPAPDGTRLKANSALWATNTGTDDYGFAALPGGRRLPTSVFDGVTLGCWFWTATIFGSDTRWQRYLEHASATVLRGTDVGTISCSVRFIVDTFNEPWPFKLFGVNFDGFERGMSVTIKRPIEVIDTHGGGVQLVPWGPAELDEWHVDAELWTSAERAQALEAAVPPYGVPSDTSWLLPPRGGASSFPGLAPASAGATADQYIYPQMTAFESQGRKGPIVDLFGYRVQAILRTYGSGAITNPSTAPTTTPPAFIKRFFTAHQIQDWSSLSPVVASAAQGVGNSFGRVKHGRRRDVNFNLDYLSPSEADQLVAWFRGVRHNPTVVLMDRGPEGIVSTTVYLVGLQLHRTALHWDGTLETVLA